MKFLHCADLHIGCCPDGNEVRFRDHCARFGELCDIAISRKADAFLIAGDLFHHRNIQPRTLQAAIEHLSRLKTASIPVIAIEGNHDKAFYTMGESWMQYLNSAGLISLLKVHYEDSQPRFAPYDGSTGSIHVVHGVRFVGFGYLGGSTRARLSHLSQQLPPFDGFTVGLLHTGVDNLRGLDLGAVTSEDLTPYRGLVDYFALGHVHTRYDNGWAFNPGAPECVHLGEARRGEKGAYWVETQDDHTFTTEFLPSLHRPVRYYAMDVTGLCEEAILNTAVKACEATQPGNMVSLFISGETPIPLNGSALREAIEAAYRPLVFEIRDETGSPGERREQHSLSLEELEQDVLKQMAQERGRAESVGALALTICNAILERQEPQALFSLLEAYLKEEPQQEGPVCE